MAGFNLDGSIKIESDGHSVEYEPGGMTVLCTLYLRIKGNDHCVPIYLDKIDDVIEMLQRGKKMIMACEP